MATFARKKTSWFKANPQVRKEFADETDLRALGESMKAKQLQPLNARPDGIILCGERRWRAAKLVGMDELDVIISDEALTETQIRLIQLQENLHRKALSGWEQYLSFYELLQARPDWQLKDLAASLNVDPATVTRVMCVSKCIASVRAALEVGKLGISDCYAISKAPEEQQAALLDEKVNGASRDDLERKVRSKRTGKTRVKRLRIPLPSGCSVAVDAANLDMKTVIASLSEVLKAAKKAHQEGIGCDAWAAAMGDLAAKETKNAAA